MMHKSKGAPPSNADAKVLNVYQKHIKNHVYYWPQLGGQPTCAHQKLQKTCKKWKVLQNIHNTKILSNILFIWHKFLACKMQINDNLLDYNNKIKALADQLICLDICVIDEYIINISLKACHSPYTYKVTTLDKRRWWRIIWWIK